MGRKSRRSNSNSPPEEVVAGRVYQVEEPHVELAEYGSFASKAGSVSVLGPGSIIGLEDEEEKQDKPMNYPDTTKTQLITPKKKIPSPEGK